MSVKSQNFFSTAFGLTPYSRGEGTYIVVDIIQNVESYVVKADIPGVSKQDVTVQADGDVLILGTTRPQPETLPEGSRYIKQERSKEFIQRAIRLPPSADIPNLVATFADGVLTVHIPKKAEAHKFPVG